MVTSCLLKSKKLKNSVLNACYKVVNGLKIFNKNWSIKKEHIKYTSEYFFYPYSKLICLQLSTKDLLLL